MKSITIVIELCAKCIIVPKFPKLQNCEFKTLFSFNFHTYTQSQACKIKYFNCYVSTIFLKISFLVKFCFLVKILKSWELNEKIYKSKSWATPTHVLYGSKKCCGFFFLQTRSTLFFFFLITKVVAIYISDYHRHNNTNIMKI